MALTYNFFSAPISLSCFISNCLLEFLRGYQFTYNQTLPLSLLCQHSHQWHYLSFPCTLSWYFFSQLSNLFNPLSTQKRKLKLWKDWSKIIQHNWSADQINIKLAVHLKGFLVKQTYAICSLEQWCVENVDSLPCSLSEDRLKTFLFLLSSENR